MHRGFIPLHGRTAGEAPVRLIAAWMALSKLVGAQMACNLAPDMEKETADNLFRNEEVDV